MQRDNPGAGDLKDTAQDPWAQGLGVFDMSALVWTHTYDPSAAEYDTPTTIKSWYSVNDLEAVPWANDQVKAMFLNSKSFEMFWFLEV